MKLGISIKRKEKQIRGARLSIPRIKMYLLGTGCAYLKVSHLKVYKTKRVLANESLLLHEPVIEHLPLLQHLFPLF